MFKVLPVAANSLRRILLLLLAGLLIGPAVAQSDSDAPDFTLNSAARREIIDGVLATVEASYVLPDVADAMVAAIRGRETHGEYDAITSARVLADSLTSHLRAVSKDQHLEVVLRIGPPPPQTEADDAERQIRRAERFRRQNYGVDRVERLQGNVGYLALRGFFPSIDGELENVYAAAMGLLSRTDALVIDLRDNRGGEPEAVQRLASYLFGPEPIHLNSLYWRPSDRTDEYWTLAELGGPRYGPDRPVYILTSDRTFSAGEEFAYNLQALDRAVLVGERTGGGAHPVDVEWVTDRVGVWVPTGRAINPVTGTNWQGTGVVPDIPTDETEALNLAHVAALRAIAAGSSDPEYRASIEDIINTLLTDE